MFKLTQVINKVKEVSIINNEISYIKDGNFYYGKTFFDVSPMLYKGDITNHNIWIKDEYWENYLLKLSDKSIKKLDFNLGLNGDISKFIMIFQNGVQSIYSVESNSIIMNFTTIEKIKQYQSIGDNLFFVNDKNIIKYYTLPNATPLWEFDLSELGSYFDTFSREEKEYEVAKFLGVWDNQLLVALREHIILSLDIQTGKIVQKWQNIEGLFYDDMTKDLIPKASSFVLYKGKLIGALHKFYFEIDLSNGTTHFTDLSSTMEENGILYIYPINDNPIDFPNIYLTAKMKEQPKKPQWSYDCLFCLDIESKEIKWKYTFEDSSLGVKTPQYSNGKLYQLDNDNILHIFEKE